MNANKTLPGIRAPSSIHLFRCYKLPFFFVRSILVNGAIVFPAFAEMVLNKVNICSG